MSWSPAELIIIRSDTLLLIIFKTAFPAIKSEFVEKSELNLNSKKSESGNNSGILPGADAGFEPSCMQRYWISSFRDNSNQIRFYSENSDLIYPIQN